MSLFFLYSDLASRYSAIFLSCLSQLSVKLPNVSFVFSRSASSPVIFFFELLMSEPAAQISFNSSNLFLSFSRDVSYDSLSDFFFSISTVILVNFFSSSASDFFKSFKSPNDLISASALAFIFKYFSFNSLYIFSFSASSFFAGSVCAFNCGIISSHLLLLSNVSLYLPSASENDLCADCILYAFSVCAIKIFLESISGLRSDCSIYSASVVSSSLNLASSSVPRS